jgi:uncharacterized coiled-coil protein SlyX
MRTPDRRSRLLAAFTAAVALCAAAPSLASQVTAVRVGVHPNFTRLVFELDGSAGYQVEKVGTDAAPELRITIDATSAMRELSAAGDIRGIKVEAGSKARARILLRQSGMRVQEMILSDPPRIVIDLVKPETALASASKPAPAHTAKVLAKQARKADAIAKPATKQTPKPAVTETAKAEVTQTPAPKATPVPPAPAETKAAAATPPTPAPMPAPPVAPVPPTPAPTAALNPAPRVSPPPSSTAQAEKPAPPPVLPPAIELPPATAPAPPAAGPNDAKLTPAEPVPPAPPAAELAPEPVKPAPSPVPAPTATPTPPRAPSTSWSNRLTRDPMIFWIGGTAAVLLGLAAIVLVRRRRSLPNDLDITAIAEGVEQTAESPTRIPSGGFAMGDDREAHSDDNSFAGPLDTPKQSAAPSWSAPPVREPATMEMPAAPAAAENSLFEDADGLLGETDSREGDAAMNSEMDLPVDRRTTPPAARTGGSAAPSSSPSPAARIGASAPPSSSPSPAARIGGSAPPSSSPSPAARMAGPAAPSPSPDLTRLFQDLERRIAALEARLDESNDAREKLERQVAAQSEELRVQRAAIARTQRALRTMTRGDEDKATEPALRDGETQTKTRVTP